MGWFDFLTSAYSRFVDLFPPATRWLVSLLIVFGLIGVLWNLARHYLLFALGLIVLVPLIIPVAASLLGDIMAFVSHVALVLHLTHS